MQVGLHGLWSSRGTMAEPDCGEVTRQALSLVRALASSSDRRRYPSLAFIACDGRRRLADQTITQAEALRLTKPAKFRFTWEQYEQWPGLVTLSARLRGESETRNRISTGKAYTRGVRVEPA